MNEHTVKVISIDNATHDVKVLRLEKPKGFQFIAGQATDLAINKPGYADQKRPFTFTSLNEWDDLELTIKIYADHNGVTQEIAGLEVGDELIISEAWGDIHYDGEGIFIAGGAGITPFIAILRDLESKHKIGNNKLIFANNKAEDIILKEDFEKMLGKNFINVLSQEKVAGYANGFITKELIQTNLDESNKMFYLCGPPPMMEAVEKILATLNISQDAIIKEGF